MSTKTLKVLEIIKQLPLNDQIYIVASISKSLEKETSEDEKRKKAAQLLLADYQNDSELTSFTVLDNEDFYESK